MKLAFVTATPQNTALGSGTFIGNAHLIAALRAQGHTVDVITPRQLNGPLGFTVHRFVWNWRLKPRDFDAYDVVVGLDMDGVTLARRIRPPFIAYIHGVIADEATFERGWVRWSLQLQARAERMNVQRAQQVITTSDYARRRLAQLYTVRAAGIAIAPPPIDLQRWDEACRQTAWQPSERLTILCVGVQYPRKNVATLIRATARLRSEFPNVAVRIASRGPQWENLRRLARELGLAGHVTFLGHIAYADLVREYLQCDIFCLPSLQEGFGLVFAEAMATRKPVVASRASSTPELIEDGVHGLLAEPRDERDLAEKLAQLMRSPQRARQLGEAGRARVTQFDAPRVAQQFLRIIETVITQTY